MCFYVHNGSCKHSWSHCHWITPPSYYSLDVCSLKIVAISSTQHYHYNFNHFILEHILWPLPQLIIPYLFIDSMMMNNRKKELFQPYSVFWNAWPNMWLRKKKETKKNLNALPMLFGIIKLNIYTNSR